MYNFNKDIIWVFSLENPERSPSNFSGGILPASYLEISKLVFLKSSKANEILQKFRPKLIIINKAFHDNVVNLARSAKELNIKVISIFDDMSFDYSNTIFVNRLETNLALAKLSDVIVVKTKKAASVLYDNIGFKAKIVQDPIRFPTSKPLSKIRYPLEVSWFGMHTNHDTLKATLDEMINLNQDVNLKIITNHLDDIKKMLSKTDYKTIKINFIEWTFSMYEEVINTDIVILPYPNDKTRDVKSSNRIVDSLNLGRCVVISDAKQFEEFRNYCFFGNISNGLQFVLENNDIAIEKTIKGQKYVKENYSLEAVSKLWKKIIENIIN